MRKARAWLVLASGLAGAAALRAVSPELPRWAGDGALALAHPPLPPLAVETLPVSRGGRVICQGDSNVRGKPAVRMPFCNELGRLAGLVVDLRGRGGDTTAEGAAHWQETSTPVQAAGDLVILLYGTNDAAPRAWLGRRRPVPPDAFRSALASLAAAWRASGATVLVLAPPPSASPAMERRLQPYRVAARQAAATAGCAFLDPVPAFAGTASQPALHRDGIHLNQRGHLALGRWLADMVRLRPPPPAPSPGPNESQGFGSTP